MTDFRTEKQKERAERDNQLINDYRNLLSEPNAYPFGIYRKLGTKYKLTIPGVIGVLRRKGAYIKGEQYNERQAQQI